MKKDKHDLIRLAKNYLRGEEIDKETFNELYEGLIQYEQFGYATEIILTRIEEIEKKGETIALKTYHELARNIYKDTTLSGYFKFEKALNVLKTHCKLDTTVDCETLGIAGAIYKYKWKFDHQFRNLLKSRAYYKKGYQLWKEDHSRLSSEYTAINYAYANELIVVKSLEQLSEIEGVTDEVIKKIQYFTKCTERNYIYLCKRRSLGKNDWS